jgi:regulator of sirC expression with transglutaminase-like and TPR domain
VLRELGTVLKRVGKTNAAMDAFREYLKRAPQADDAAMIRSYLNAK